MWRLIRNPGFIFAVVTFVLLSAFITARNLGWEKSFAGEDYGVWYDFPQRALNLVYFTWDSFSAPGKINVTSVISFLWINWIYLLYFVGMHPILIQRFIYFMFFSVAGIGMYSLLRLLVRVHYPRQESRWTNFACICGGLFYILNHFVMQLVSIPISPYHLPHMFLPIIFALFVYNVQIRTTFFSILAFVISYLIMLNGNPSNFLPVTMIFMMYGGMFFKDIKAAKTSAKKFVFWSSVLVVLLTAYIYLPILSIKSNPYGAIDFEKDVLMSLRFNSQNTSFPNLFLLAGMVIWQNFSYFEAYTRNFGLLVMGYGIAIIPYLSLIFSRARRIKLFFAIIIAISLFFGKGVHAPFEKISLALFTYLPLFGMFRAVYYKFVYLAMFAYAGLITFFILDIRNFIMGYFKNYLFNLYKVFYLLPLIIGIYAWPFFSGILVQYSHGDVLTKIPPEYSQIGKYTESDPADFKVLALPPAPKGAGLILQWEGTNKYIGLHPDLIFLNRPVLDSYWFIRKGFYGLTNDDSWTGTKFESLFPEIIKFINIYNIRYLFLHKDFVESYSFDDKKDPVKIEGVKKTKELQKFLSSQPGVEIVKDTIYFTLYKLDDRYFYPHIYIPQVNLYANIELDLTLDVLTLRDSQSPVIINTFRTVKSEKPDQLATEMLDVVPSEVFIEGNLRNRIYDDELMLPKQAFFREKPYVAVLPDNLFYPLIHLREEFDIRGQKNTVAKFKKYFFYAEKRLKEIVAYGAKTHKLSAIILAEYERFLREAMKVAIENRDSDIASERALVRLFSANLPFHYEIIEETKLSEDLKLELESKIESFEKQIIAQQTPYDFDNFVYDFYIPSTGEYEVYISNENNPWKVIKNEFYDSGQHQLTFSKEDLIDYLIADESANGYPHNTRLLVEFDYQYKGDDDSLIFFRDDEIDYLLDLLEVPKTGESFRHYEAFFARDARVYNPQIHTKDKQINNLSIRRLYEPKILIKRVDEDTTNSYFRPKITFQKINPVKYKVSVSEATTPYVLVFSEGFDRNWKAYITGRSKTSVKGQPVLAEFFDGFVREAKHKHEFLNKELFETWGLSPIRDDRHFMINGYANSWYIKPEDVNGADEYEIILEFYPQRLYYAGLTIFVLTILGIIVWIIINRIRNKDII